MPNYDIYISGQLLDGATPENTATTLAKLLKIEKARAAALLDGKPHILKKNVTKEVALKFKRALESIGVQLAAKELAQDTAFSPNTADAAETTSNSTELVLDKFGAPTLHEHERKKFEAADIDVSRFSAELADRIAPEKAPGPPPPNVDFPLAQAGADLEELPREAPIQVPDVSHLSVQD